jgi:RNA polymerase sigma-70 factor (ECF subfamily)
MNLLMADGATSGPGGDEDTRLLVASRRDIAAFEALYRRNWGRILAYFYRRILCPHTSNEMAAETFAQAFESRHRYTPAGGTGIAWIFGIAGNLYRDWLRHEVVIDRARRKFKIEPPELGQEDLERIENLVDLAAFRASLQDGLDRLSPKLRDAVLLRVALDLPYDEVAVELGCSVGAARVRVSRGLEKLLLQLEMT